MAGQPLPDNFAEFALEPDRFLVDGRASARPRQPAGLAAHAGSHPRARVLLRQRPQRGADRRPHPAPDHAQHQPGPGETADTLGQYLASLSAMSGLAVDEVLPADEYRFIGLASRIAGLRAHHQARLAEVLALLRAVPGRTSVQVAEKLVWSRPWDQMQGMQRRFAVGEAYSHLVHLEQTGFVVNKGIDVDSWYPLRDVDPQL